MQPTSLHKPTCIFIERVQMDHETVCYFAHLSDMQCWSNRSLLSRFRIGCHGLHDDGNRVSHLDRGDRLCLCASLHAVEDEQHLSLIVLLMLLLGSEVQIFFSKLDSSRLFAQK